MLTIPAMPASGLLLSTVIFNGACPKCHGKMKILSFIEDEEITRPLPSSGIRKLA
jgi:hypothetical protein